MSDASPATGPPPQAEGLIVLRNSDPVESARALAEQLGGAVAIGGRAVSEAVGHRLRTQHLGLAAEPRNIDLARLGEAMRRAETVLEKTRERVAGNLARSLNTSLAVHPHTIRRAAAQVTDAEHALRRARRGSPPTRSRHRILAAAISIAVLTVGVLRSTSGHLLVGSILILLGGAVLALVDTHVRQTCRRTIPSRSNDVELALRRWHQVAGQNVEPDDLERVLARFDPHHDTVVRLATEHPAVRAAERAVADRRRAWVRGWRIAVGDMPDDTSSAFAPRRPLVLGDLYGGLDSVSARRLHADLRRLDRDSGVVVVLGEAVVSADTGGVTIDLRSERDEFAPGEPGVEVQLA